MAPDTSEDVRGCVVIFFLSSVDSRAKSMSSDDVAIKVCHGDEDCPVVGYDSFELLCGAVERSRSATFAQSKRCPITMFVARKMDL